MIIDNKKRVVGKVVSIDSDRFSVELLSGIKNFNVNGYDDIHYFAQINSYVIIPYQNHYIVAEVINVREKDIASFVAPKEQELSKVYSVKYLDVFPVGTIKDKSFSFGVAVYPTLYSDVLYIKDSELDLIFGTSNSDKPICHECYQNPFTSCEEHKDEAKINSTRSISLDIGKSVIFPDYAMKVGIDNFFGSHSAVLGNTGSGKSCTIASMLQTLYKKKDYSAIGSNFIIFDVNGEYGKAFNKLGNTDISVKEFSIETNSEDQKFYLPHNLFTIQEWELLLQASEKTQQPVLRTALSLASLFGENSELIEKKNHILATCITTILRDESSSPSKKDRILSILKKFSTVDINLDKEFDLGNDHEPIAIQKKQYPCTIRNCIRVNFGELVGVEQLQNYLEQKNEDGTGTFIKEQCEIPQYLDNASFEFKHLGEALDLAILYEEAYGNKQIRDYCSSLITRFKNIKDRNDLEFITKAKYDVGEKYVSSNILGLNENKKERQITIINLDSVDDEIVEIVSSVLTRLIFDWLKKRHERNVFPINLILEEAHRYISNNKQRNFIKANQIFERAAKEGRKYGLFLLISSQRPSELSKSVLSQCNNFIVHRIQNPDDLSHIRQITPHISEATLKKLPSIPKQNALVFGSAVNIPALFIVNTAKPTPKSADNEISKNWFVDSEKEFSI